jgi:ELWxxDGT repeat protein
MKPARLLSLTAITISLAVFLVLKGCSLTRPWEGPRARKKPALAANLALVANLNKQPARPEGFLRSAPCYSAALKSVFFAGWDAEHGVELWKTRVGSSRAERVADILPGLKSSRPAEITAWKNRVFFAAAADNAIEHVWTSDGAASGTLPLLPLTSDFAPTGPHYFLPAENCLFFLAFTNNKPPVQMWRTDGTADGTFPIYTFPPSYAGSSGDGRIARDLFYRPGLAAICKNTAFWIALSGFPNQPGGSSELWKSGGAEEDTQCILHNTSAMLLAPSGESVFFFAPKDSRYMPGRSPLDLWKTDGTTSGTQKVAGPFLQRFSSSSPLAVKDRMYFAAAGEGDNCGEELWVSDGTPQGTRMVKDIVPGKESSFPREFLAFRNKAFFFATDTPGRRTLYVTDGTAEGTLPLKSMEILRTNRAGLPFFERSAAGASTSEFLMFPANEDDKRVALWKSDGTPGRTKRVRTLASPSNLPVIPGNFTAAGDHVYFTAPDGEDLALWVSNGKRWGTRPVRKAALPDASSGDIRLAPMGDSLIFADSQAFWKTSGAGYEPVGRDLAFFPPNSFQEWMRMGERVYFTGNLKTPRQEKPGKYLSVWVGVTDGTSKGTRVLAIPQDANDWGNPRCLRGVGNDWFFVTGNPYTVSWMPQNQCNALWAARANAEEARIVKRFDRPIATTISCREKIFVFLQSTAEKSIEIWESNGSEEGTHLFQTVGTADEGCAEAVALGNQFLFTTGKKAYGGSQIDTREIRTCDCLSGRLAAIIQDESVLIRPKNLMTVGNRVFFLAQVPDSGWGVWRGSLWCTDGTREGTWKITSYQNDPQKEFESPIIGSLNGVLFFGAPGSRETGYEIWKSNGTPAGTALLKDLNPGAGSSILGKGAIRRGKMYFLAGPVDGGIFLWETDGTEKGTRRLPGDAPQGLKISLDYLAAAGDRLYFMADDGRHGKELWSYRIPASRDPVKP